MTRRQYVDDDCNNCQHPRSEHYGGQDGSCMDTGQDGDTECSCKWFEPRVQHGITAYWTAFGWTWACRCGTESKGNGAARTQLAAYAYGEKHIRNALRKERAS